MAEKFLNEAGLAFYDQRQRERLARKADADAVPVRVSQLDNDAGFLAPGGDGSGVRVAFPQETGRALPVSGDSLAELAGKVTAWLEALSPLASGSGVSVEALDSAVRASLDRADSALQSFTEQDPTVPAWAKAPCKPAYTAEEVGAIPLGLAGEFARKEDLARVYRYRGSVQQFDDLPGQEQQVGDVWNVEETDMNYGWTGERWDPLGQIFSVRALSNEELDAIMNQ